METKLKPYMVFSRHAGPEEGAVLVFHFTSRQARYLGWQHEPLMGCEYIDSASWLVPDPENVYPLTNRAWLVDNQPHAVVSPEYCQSCEFWGCGVDKNGRCHRCGEYVGDVLFELFKKWRCYVETVEVNDLSAEIELEKTASPVRRLGLEIIYAMKASAYGVSREDGRLFALDCFLMIGGYADMDMTTEHDKGYVEFERQRLIEQADFAGEHIDKFLKERGLLHDG